MTKPSFWISIRSFGILCSLIFLVSTVSGQITNVTGDQAAPVEGVGHDYVHMLNETVNPANGSVSLRINLNVPNSRGFSVPFAIGYDSNSALHALQGAWTDNSFGSAIAARGWSYLFPYINIQWNNITYPNTSGPPYQCYYYTNYIFTDLAGGTHALPISSTMQGSNQQSASCQYDGPWNPAGVPTGGDAIVQAVTTTNFTQYGPPPPISVADKDGTVYYFSDSLQQSLYGPAYQFLPDWIEDRNGNKAVLAPTSTTSVQFAATDSAGRTAFSVSGFGSTGNTVEVSGAGTYTLSWQAVNAPPAPTTATYDINPGGGFKGQCSAGGSSLYASAISKIALPNGQSYTFVYDPVSSLIQKIIYPSGGYVRYVWSSYPSREWSVFPNSADNAKGADCEIVTSVYMLSNRYVSFDGVTEVQEQDFSYPTPNWITCGTSSQYGCAQSDQLVWTQRQTNVATKILVNGSMQLLGTTIYTYTPFLVANLPNNSVVNGSSATPVENVTTYENASSAALRTVTKTWLSYQLPPTSELTQLDTGQTSEITRSYAGGILTDVYDYDYGPASKPGTPGSLLKHTHTDYASFADTPIYPFGPSILDRPSDVIVCQSATCSASNEIAETDYAYDGTAVSSVSSATEHDETNYSASYNVRGNATTKTVKCLQAGCSNTVSTYTYDETGQTLSMTDPCGNGTCSDMTGTSHATTYSYANSYTILSGGSNESYTPNGNTNAYVTAVTNALGQSISFTYDYNNGQLTKSTDANNESTTYIYNDPFSRPTQVNYPDGGQKSLVYNDTPYAPFTQCSNSSLPTPNVTTTTLVTSGSSGISMVNTAAFDGVGHQAATILQSDPTGPDCTSTTYFGTGNPYQAANPHRSTSSSTDGTTQYAYDALGRTISVTEPDGSITTTTYDQTNTNSTGVCTTVTDEAGKLRQSCSDALGRLTGVWEDSGSSPHLNFETDYTYDALSDLLSVTQKGGQTSNWRVRSFVYDSLSRLTSATNPESGQMIYSYDANSNLSTKTAPSPNQSSIGTATVATNYTYDALNRLTGKSYVDGYTSNPQTPPVTYGYDGVNLTCATPVGFAGGGAAKNVVGRRTAMCYSTGNKSWIYDPMGRIYAENDRFIGLVPPYNSAVVVSLNGVETASANTVYAYYLNGDLQGDSSPAWYEYYTDENAAGEVTTVGDELFNVLTLATYTPTGQLAHGWASGDGTTGAMQITNTYNSRLQPTNISAVTSTGATILNLTYNFNAGNGTAGSGTDNGNLIQIANGKDSNRTENFLYDPLNRIWQAYTNGTNWGETYSPTTQAAGTAFSAANAGIDPWGNLTNISGVTGQSSGESLSCPVTPKNRFQTTCGIIYDAAGNLIQNGSVTYTYDAENRIIATGGYSYIYDGDGNRVEKCTELFVNNVYYPGQCATNATGMFYWLHQNGHTLNESDLGGNFTAAYDLIHGQIAARIDLPSDVVHYYFKDNLGSTSIVTDASGNIQEEQDYYPYGGVVPNSSLPNTDSNRYKFTGKERDSESGLDNFEARYLGSSLGRFMSPDPMGGDTKDPQSLNRYAYVRNNPLKLTDPTGLNFNLSCTGPDTATCQGGLQGTTTTTTTTDANGNQTTTSTFTATEISNDKNGNLVDQNGNHYSGTFDGTNVSFTQNGSTQSSTGVWKEGSDPTSGITGGGALDDSFHFTFAQHGAGQKLNAFGYHVGSPEDAIRMLGAAGIRFSMLDTIFNVREMVDHPGALNFRSSGDQGTGANSTHLLLDRTPSATVPWAQTFNLHTGETNPWENLGAAWQHAVNEQ